MRYGGLLLFFTYVLLAACRTDDGDVVRVNPTSFTAADERVIATALRAARWRDGNITELPYGDGAFTDSAYVYLDGLLRGLVDQGAVARRDSFDWEVVLVLDKAEHAYTLPGGKIVLHTGLLHALRNEAECVGLLAREIAIAEVGAAMHALDRQVEDNVLLGDILLETAGVDVAPIVEGLPDLAYTQAELNVVDSVATLVLCETDYEERALPWAADRLDASAGYLWARPAARSWPAVFADRVAGCPGADSLYAGRYREVVERFVPM